MNIPGIDEWIKHLSNPLVLVAFAIMIFALVAVKLKGARNQTIRRSLLFLFILSLIAGVTGIISLLKTSDHSEKSSILQESKGSQSPNIQGSKNVNISYEKRDMQSEHSESGKTPADSSRLQIKSVPQNVTQKSSGPQSPNISGSGNVNISY